MAGMTVLIFFVVSHFLLCPSQNHEDARMLIVSKTMKDIAFANIYSSLSSPDFVLLTFVLY